MSTRAFSSPTPAGRERELVERFSVIEDRQERMQALAARKPLVAQVPVAERTEHLLVHGCSSPVWVKSRVDGPTLHLQMASDSVLVYSLAGIVCDLCDGCSWEDVQNYLPGWIDGLGLQNVLSSSRQQGLDAVLRAVRSAGV